jgi:hypothetical protein
MSSRGCRLFGGEKIKVESKSMTDNMIICKQEPSGAYGGTADCELQQYHRIGAAFKMK